MFRKASNSLIIGNSIDSDITTFAVFFLSFLGLLNSGFLFAGHLNN